MSLLLSVEGNIGSGKSTFIKNLSQLEKMLGKPVVLLQEPIDVWSTVKDKDGETILEKFYKDPEKNAFSFQMLSFFTRLELLHETIKNNPHKIIICERSIWTDKNVFAHMLRDDNKINEIDFIIYNIYFQKLSKDLVLDGIIYIHTPLDTCKKRIDIRNRKGEEISLDYLKKCDAYHNRWLENINPIKIIDGNTLHEDRPYGQLQDLSKFILDLFHSKFPTNVSHSDIFYKIRC